MGKIRIGISGWRYAPWRGVFYPEGLPQRSELEFAARAFVSIEINGSFYSLQRPESYDQWYRDELAGMAESLEGEILQIALPESPLESRAQFGPDPIADMTPPVLTPRMCGPTPR